MFPSFLSRAARAGFAAVVFAATVAPEGLNAQSITQPAGNQSPLYFWGKAGVPTVGQSFKAIGTSLTSFTFWLTNEALTGTPENTPNAETLTFNAYLAEWDDQTKSIVGPLLYSSDVQSGPSSANLPYVFNTGGLTLTSDNFYVAFLTVSESSPDDAFAAIDVSDESTAGGEAVIAFSTDVAALTTDASNWQGNTGTQLRFAADFAQVPEPTTAVLTLVGLAGIAVRARRRTS